MLEKLKMSSLADKQRAEAEAGTAIPQKEKASPERKPLKSKKKIKVEKLKGVKKLKGKKKK